MVFAGDRVRGQAFAVGRPHRSRDYQYP